MDIKITRPGKKFCKGCNEWKEIKEFRERDKDLACDSRCRLCLGVRKYEKNENKRRKR